MFLSGFKGFRTFLTLLIVMQEFQSILSAAIIDKNTPSESLETHWKVKSAYKLAKNTTTLLGQLRQLMTNTKIEGKSIKAYIIPPGDAHMNEFVAACDERRSFITGFTGSAGTAVVTENQALLWTDERYYLQAEQQLDENWTLMNEDVPDTPSQSRWLNENLPSGSRVGVDPLVYSVERWRKMEEALHEGGKILTAVKNNLVDLVWLDRPSRSLDPAKVLEIQYTGRSTTDKLTHIRNEMHKNGAGALVVSELDQIAWLLNLRGSDIPYNPLFFSYVIITSTNVELFISSAKLKDPTILKTLKEDIKNIVIHPYEAVLEKLSTVVDNEKGKIWLSKKVSKALAAVVPENRRILKLTPIALMKSLKNPVEIHGMINTNVRDGAALCTYLAWLEEALLNGTQLTEISAATKLEYFRSQQPLYVGLSFGTVSSSGPNGAIIHYKPTKESDRKLSLDEMYLVDSGGQYLDGTTDVTRTVHFGTPTEYQKECFTRVLKGQIALRQAIFPRNIQGHVLDAFARKALWDVGLDYKHGSGHGIGAYLIVHEGPQRINFEEEPDDPGLQENMFLTNEPGYYEAGNFGIRLENTIRIVPAKTRHNLSQQGFLTFEDVTFTPFQQKLIQLNLLTKSELQYINEYHKKTRQIVGDYLGNFKDNADYARGLEWLVKETEPISV